ncbi:MAG: adenine phosphoribosyltransferase [Chloroflexaceae bacterium]|nr:adenine phosphoribosyltransferase [Chloroflexaceae bacterium]NJO05473.1 adenine phosphoribosyltransferase [Chloroflexaceae bacterium]
MTEQHLATLIRNVPDFPQPGIQFKDITTLLQDGAAFRETIELLRVRYADRNLDAIVGVESRGFILSAPLAYALGVGLVPVRKAGKLPSATYRVEYELEYGTNQLEIHRDALQRGARVLVVDDLLATGGTIGAAAALVEQLGGIVEEMAFLIELTFLKGREKLARYPLYSIIQY